MPKEEFIGRYKKLSVNKAEILAVRLYTGPMYELYNHVLRAAQIKPAPGSLTEPAQLTGDRTYPHGPGRTSTGVLSDGKTAGRFVTTIHSINSAILKLSQLTPIATVYRGCSGRDMPEQLLRPDAWGSKLGIEYGLMSTTTSKAVALHYSKDRDAERGLSYVMEFEMDGLNRGAMIQFLSQYPKEEEVLFGPLTGLEVMQQSWLHGVRHPELKLNIPA